MARAIKHINLNFDGDNVISYDIERDIGDDWWKATISMKAISPSDVPDQGDLVTLIDVDGSPVFRGIVDENDYVYSSPGNIYRFSVYSFEYILDKQYLTTAKTWRDQITTAIKVVKKNEDEADLVQAYENPMYYLKRLLFGCSLASGTEIQIQAIPKTNPINLKSEIGGVVTNLVFDYNQNITGIENSGKIHHVPFWDGNCKPWSGGVNTTGGRWDIRWKQFKFNTNTTKLRAINEICDYCNMIFYCHVANVTENNNTVVKYLARFVHESDVDELDSMGGYIREIDVDTGMVFPDILRNSGGGSIYNRVDCVAYDKNSGDIYTASRPVMVNTFRKDAKGNWIYVQKGGYAIPYRYEVSDGLRLIEENDTAAVKTQKRTDNQNYVDARATQLAEFFAEDDILYTVPMKYTPGIRPYNRVKITGLPQNHDIAGKVCRVTSVRHQKEGGKNITVIKCQQDRQWRLARELNRLIGSSYKNAQKELKEDFFVDLTEIEVGRLEAVSPNGRYGITRLNSGGKVQVILLNNNKGV